MKILNCHGNLIINLSNVINPQYLEEWAVVNVLTTWERKRKEVGHLVDRNGSVLLWAVDGPESLLSNASSYCLFWGMKLRGAI